MKVSPTGFLAAPGSAQVQLVLWKPRNKKSAGTKSMWPCQVCIFWMYLYSTSILYNDLAFLFPFHSLFLFSYRLSHSLTSWAGFFNICFQFIFSLKQMTKFLTAVFQGKVHRDIAQWYLNFPNREISFPNNLRDMFSYLCLSYQVLPLVIGEYIKIYLSHISLISL